MPRTTSINQLRVGASLRVLAWLPLMVWSAAVPAVSMEVEVDQLLARVELSGCEFYRNGTWADGATARAHLARKFRALRDRNLVTTTEQFIERGATRSSMSGEAYRVRCPGTPDVESAKWFGDVLHGLRAQPPSSR